MRRLVELLAPAEGCAAADRGAKMEALTGNVWRLAADKDGSHLLQELLVHVPACHRVVVEELKKHVNEAWQKPEVARHANHVLQKLVEVLPPESCHFIRDELLGVDSILDVAHNLYGCRILQRLIEHFQPDEVRELMDRLLTPQETLSKLIASRYGNYVLQCILEHGEQKCKTKIARALTQSNEFLETIATNKYGSHVVQAALTLCPETDKEHLANCIEALAKRIEKTHSGSYVVRWARSGKPKGTQGAASVKRAGHSDS